MPSICLKSSRSNCSPFVKNITESLDLLKNWVEAKQRFMIMESFFGLELTRIKIFCPGGVSLCFFFTLIGANAGDLLWRSRLRRCWDLISGWKRKAGAQPSETVRGRTPIRRKRRLTDVTYGFVWVPFRGTDLASRWYPFQETKTSEFPSNQSTPLSSKSSPVPSQLG